VAELVVINTGPLIAFSRLGCLDVVGKLPYEFICPQEVRQELDAGEALGHPRIRPSWLAIRELRDPLPILTVASLDRGEAAVIQLAIELAIGTVAIDEWKGRRAALASGLRVTGSLGILGRAKMLGVIPSLKPLLERATSAGLRYHPELVQAVLKAADE
jgi:predicted nucleic acid-binding protein